MATLSAQRLDIDFRPPNVIAMLILAILGGAGAYTSFQSGNPVPAIVGIGLGLIAMQAPKIAQQWERAIILRLGRFHAMQGPGLFWIVPFVDRVSSWIDQRTITTSFAAEQTLTSDRVRSTSTLCSSGWCTTHKRRRSKCRSTNRP